MGEFTFRDAARERTPRWLRGWFGERLVYAVAVQLDAVMDGVVAGVRLRWPGLRGYEAIDLVAGSRGELRALDETDEDFAAALTQWRANARFVGGPYRLLERLRRHLGTRHTGAWVEVVYTSGRRFTLDVAGEITRSDGPWDWDGLSAQWSRFWVVIHGCNWASDGTWGDAGTWGDGGTIGSDMTVEESNTIRQIVADETGPWFSCVRVVVVLDEDEWAANEPDGTWQLWGNRHPAGILYLDGR